MTKTSIYDGLTIPEIEALHAQQQAALKRKFIIYMCILALAVMAAASYFYVHGYFDGLSF